LYLFLRSIFALSSYVSLGFPTGVFRNNNGLGRESGAADNKRGEGMVRTLMTINILKEKKEMRSIREKKRPVTLGENIHTHNAGLREQDAKKNAWMQYNLQKTAQLEPM